MNHQPENTNPQFPPGAVLAAAPDAIQLAAGIAVNHPHPLAEGLTLLQIAFAAGARVREPRPGEADMQVSARGMSSLEFGGALTGAFKAHTISAYDAQAADHLQFGSIIEVPNFHAAEVGSHDTDIDLEQVDELAHIQHGGVATLTAGASPVRLTQYARRLLVSRESIINDQSRLVAQIVAGAGASAGRLESRLVARALEAPPALDDGLPVFGADHGNVVEQALTAEALGAAMAALRTQSTSNGQRANLRARHIVTSPELEFEARRLIRDAGLELTVSVLADLPAQRWYVLADKVAAPVVGLLRLAGTKNPVRVEARKTPFEMDGNLIQVSADFGVSLLRRVGIVRGGETT